MGVVNITPDSFFDGGRYFDSAVAIAHGRALIAEGADLVDVGGESTRPGADPVDEAEELRRVLPVIAALSPSCRVSIDTTKALVAQEAVAAGASLVNDVSGTLGPVAAALGVGLVVMHMRGTPKTMQRDASYDDVVDEVFSWLAAAAKRAHALGIEEVYVDPGIGFAKNTEHNLALLSGLPQLVSLGEPVLVGTSRKSFLGRIAARTDGEVAPLGERLEASVATAIYAMACGAAMVRVHDVAVTADAARLVAACKGELSADQMVERSQLAVGAAR
jgi:dihydropteroate synthase